MLNLAAYIRSPDRSTKSTISHLDVLYVLVNTGFQVLFHSPPGVLFTFPSQYFSTIGHRVIFRLGGWSPLLPTGFLVSRGTPDPARCLEISPTCLSHSPVGLPMPFGYLLTCSMQSSTPVVLLPPVWPFARSLATTCAISFDFSSLPYLDVSVRAVPLIWLFDSPYDTKSLNLVSLLIQKSADQRSFASPRSFSQLITSFVGSRCQGIHPALFFA